MGTYLFLLNGVIIVTAGAVYGPEKALYTLVTLYTSTRVVDAIHTRHEKLTFLYVQSKSFVNNEKNSGFHIRKPLLLKFISLSVYNGTTVNMDNLSTDIG